MWETMGPIADRSRERVGSSDIAVVAFRRIMVEAVRQFMAGAPAIGTADPKVPHATISSYERIVPKAVDWRNIGDGSQGAASMEAAE